MNREIDQFFLRQRLVPRVFQIVCYALCALIMLLAAIGNHLPEIDIICIAVVRQRFSLKNAFGKVTQMHDKSAEVQRLPVKLLVIIRFYHINAAIYELGDVLHLWHVRIHFRIDNVQGNKRCLIVIQRNTGFLPDGL